MSIVKNVTLEPVDLPDGRIVAPGAKASRVDLEDPHVAAFVAAGALIHASIPTSQEPAS